MKQRDLRFTVGLVISVFIFVQGCFVQRAEAYENFLKRLLYVSPINTDISKEEVQRRILDALTYENTVGGKVVSKYSAFFEGCVLVRRLDRLKSGCPRINYWLLDFRIDLGFLETHPVDVQQWTPKRKQRITPPTTTFYYQYVAGPGERLRKIDEQSSTIVKQEFIRIPEGGDARMRVLGKRFTEELKDKIYKNAGQITSWCSGFDTQGPFGIGGDVRIRVPIEKSEEFPPLIHVYHDRYCKQQ